MITVVIATKNGSAYIQRALDSIYKQSVTRSDSPSFDPHFKVRVVSDGSTDSTDSIVHEHIIKEPRTTLISLKHSVGPGKARNLAILGGTTEDGTGIEPIDETLSPYIAFLDDDDMWKSEIKLERQLMFLNSNPSVFVVGSDTTEFRDERGTVLKTIKSPIDPISIKNNILSYNPLITSSVVCRTDIFKTLGGFKPMFLAEDYDLWLRIGQTGNISNVNHSDIIYTVRQKSASNSRRVEMAKTVLYLVKEYRYTYPGYVKALLKAYARLLLSYIK